MTGYHISKNHSWPNLWIFFNPNFFKKTQKSTFLYVIKYFTVTGQIWVKESWKLWKTSIIFIFWYLLAYFRNNDPSDLNQFEIPRNIKVCSLFWHFVESLPWQNRLFGLHTYDCNMIFHLLPVSSNWVKMWVWHNLQVKKYENRKIAFPIPCYLNKWMFTNIDSPFVCGAE